VRVTSADTGENAGVADATTAAKAMLSATATAVTGPRLLLCDATCTSCESPRSPSN
jgi:hypothetical protein